MCHLEANSPDHFHTSISIPFWLQKQERTRENRERQSQREKERSCSLLRRLRAQRLWRASLTLLPGFGHSKAETTASSPPERLRPCALPTPDSVSPSLLLKTTCMHPFTDWQGHFMTVLVQELRSKADFLWSLQLTPVPPPSFHCVLFFSVGCCDHFMGCLELPHEWRAGTSPSFLFYAPKLYNAEQIDVQLTALLQISTLAVTVNLC